MQPLTTPCLRSQALYTIVFVFLLSSGPLSAQTVIEGIVMDNINDIPIPGANITINGTETGTYSQDDGTFELAIRQKLPARISVTFLGYELKEIDITSPHGQSSGFTGAGGAGRSGSGGLCLEKARKSAGGTIRHGCGGGKGIAGRYRQQSLPVIAQQDGAGCGTNRD